MDLVVPLLLLLILPAPCNGIPFIAYVSLVPRSSKSITTLYNSSCDQCLCSAFANGSVAVNCFLNNNTCQLFAYAPASYGLQSNPKATLYFINKTLPSPSKCCMPNTTLLIQKLQNASSISINFSNPRCLVIDDHGFLVTVEEHKSNISRFDPRSLVLINTTMFLNSSMNTLAYHQGAYFLGTDNNTILIVNSSSLTLINTVKALGKIDAPRDIIFLKDGQIMIVASGKNRQLLFFNRSSGPVRDYAFVSNMSVSYNWPHGLWYVNDTFFYATSYEWKTVYSYATSDNGATWNESVYINSTGLSSSRWIGHVMVDDCGRRWLSTADTGLLIYNAQGQLLGTFNSTRNATFDAIFMDNYVMLLSDRTANKIIRLDPQINC